MTLSTPSDRFAIFGSRGMAGSAICRALESAGYHQLLIASRYELNLLDGHAMEVWFAKHQPKVVVLAAAKLGGIQANSSYPADFLLENLKIQTHVIEMAWRSVVRWALFLGTSYIYPKFAEQPNRGDVGEQGPGAFLLDMHPFS
jgi:GDP-L-fucose synthase